MVHRTTETDWKSLYEAETRICARQAAEIVRLREQSSVITEQSMTWQHIDTAPTDGTAILLYVPMNRPGMRILAAKAGDYEWWILSGSVVLGKPTHWMPLPVPPTGQP